MFYEVVFDMERIDKAIEEGTNTIFAEDSNLDEIVYPNVKKGFFKYIIYKGKKIIDWPNIEFYYSSKASNLESEYLLNVHRWSIVHKQVQKKFIEEGITGIQYLPIKLFDTVTNKVNDNYVVMNILNFIDAYDMKKSKYTYNKKYDLYSFLPKGAYLDKEECSKYDIFRCKKDFPGLYVSQKVKNIIEENKWIGFDFYKQKTNEDI